jgi:hypothetical protein
MFEIMAEVIYHAGDPGEARRFSQLVIHSGMGKQSRRKTLIDIDWKGRKYEPR